MREEGEEGGGRDKGRRRMEEREKDWKREALVVLTDQARPGQESDRGTNEVQPGKYSFGAPLVSSCLVQPVGRPSVSSFGCLGTWPRYLGAWLSQSPNFT